MIYQLAKISAIFYYQKSDPEQEDTSRIFGEEDPGGIRCRIAEPL
jgi:hypothetical protein